MTSAAAYMRVKMINNDPSPDFEASIVIPVYNGADTIPELADRLSRVCPTLFSNYEIIFIDDGSPDPSWATIQRLTATVPNVVGVRLRRNFGQHNATLCGIRAARFPITITMDDDLQHPPEQLPALLDEFRKGYDVVYAVPKKLPHAWWRNLGSRMIKLILSKIMNIPIQDIGAFRIFRTELRDAFADYHSPDVYIDPLLSWGTTSFSHIAVEEKPRTVGESNYTMKSLIKATLSIMTGYSTIPLRLASMLGFFFLIFGVIVLIYVLYIAIVVGSIPGWPFLASLVSLFSGAELFSLGLIGEYLARMYVRTMDRPVYLVAERSAAAKTKGQGE